MSNNSRPSNFRLLSLLLPAGCATVVSYTLSIQFIEFCVYNAAANSQLPSYIDRLIYRLVFIFIYIHLPNGALLSFPLYSCNRYSLNSAAERRKEIVFFSRPGITVLSRRSSSYKRHPNGFDIASFLVDTVACIMSTPQSKYIYIYRLYMDKEGRGQGERGTFLSLVK